MTFLPKMLGFFIDEKYCLLSMLQMDFSLLFTQFFSFFPSCSTKSVCLDCCLYVNKRVISMSFNPPDVVCSLSSFVTSKHSTIFSSSDMHGFFFKTRSSH